VHLTRSEQASFYRKIGGSTYISVAYFEQLPLKGDAQQRTSNDLSQRMAAQNYTATSSPVPAEPARAA